MTNSTTTRNTINLILTILMIVTMIGTSFAKGVQFETSASYAEILRQAQAESKPIFLDFYTTWCGPCRWMDQDVFQLEVVGALFNENFVSVKVNAERGEGPALAKKFGVTSFPTLIYLNSNGEVVKQQLGMTTASKVMNQATEVMTAHPPKRLVQIRKTIKPTQTKLAPSKKATKKIRKEQNSTTKTSPRKTSKQTTKTAPTKIRKQAKKIQPIKLAKTVNNSIATPSVKVESKKTTTTQFNTNQQDGKPALSLKVEKKPIRKLLNLSILSSLETSTIKITKTNMTIATFNELTKHLNSYRIKAELNPFFQRTQNNFGPIEKIKELHNQEQRVLFASQKTEVNL